MFPGDKPFELEVNLKYTFESRVRYSEIGKDGSMTIPSVINYFQDCSTFQSEQLHVGLDYLKETGRIWMLNTWHIELKQPIPLGTDIRISTWAYKFDAVFGYRNFMICDNMDTVLAKADTKWVLYDVNQQSLVRIQAEDVAAYGEGQPLAMELPSKKLRKPKAGEVIDSITVPTYFIDTNGHMNNARYVELALEYLPVDMECSVIDVLYKQQAVVGDVIRIMRTVQEDGVTVTLMGADETQLHAIICFR